LSDMRDHVARLVLEAADRLRRLGYQVSTAEIVKAVRLAYTYWLLTGTLARHDLHAILKASFTVADPDEDDLSEVVRLVYAGSDLQERTQRIIEDIMSDIRLVGGRPGSYVSKKRLSKKSSREERSRALHAYLRLKRVGAIRGEPGRERLLEKGEIERLAFNLASRGYESLDDALRDADIAWSWDDLLLQAETRSRVPEKAIREAPEKKLVRLARAARRKGDWKLLESVGKELARRALRGEVKQKEEVSRLLEDAGMLTPSVKKALARGLDEDKLDLEDVAALARSLDREEASRLVARKMRRLEPRDAARLAQMVDPSLLWAAKPPRGGGRETAATASVIYAAKALREAVLYAETGEQGRADMALYYKEKAESLLSEAASWAERARRLLEEAESIVRIVDSLSSAPEGSRPLLEEVVVRLDYTTAVRVLRSTYHRAPDEWKGLLERSMERLLHRFAARDGLRLLPESMVQPIPPGRLEVRHSIYNMVRLRARPFAYRRRLRANPLVLALDASGSMLDYAAWSIGVASLFPRHLKRLIVFRETPEVHEGPFARRVFAQILLATRFQGYTNISAALEAAAMPGISRIVVVTDLHQTVNDVPVEVVVSDLRARGKRVTFIVPPNHDQETRRLVEKARARVLTARTPEEVARLLLRALLR